MNVPITHFAFADTCKFDLDTSSAKVTWTAFKTTQKVQVAGSFTSVDYSGSVSQQKSLNALLKGIHAKIAVKDATSSTTGNPARDQTLFDHFFSKLAPNAVIEGKVKKITGDDHEGTLDLGLVINRKSHVVSAHYILSPDGQLEAKASFDLLDFALSGPLDELHHACEALHKGADGVSKTWSNIDIKFNAHVNQKCNP